MGCGASTANSPEGAYISSPSAAPRYLRKQLLGKGTYGQVYRCIDNQTGKEHAMKVIKVNQKTKEEAMSHIQQLKMQIAMLKKLNHPFIVKYESFDVTPDLEEVEIVMEIVKSGTLKEYIDKNGPFPQVKAASVCEKILKALDYLHSQNIIHRDLKCANILLTESLVPKLTDFGTAKIIIRENNDDIAKLCASLKGTPFYMAPQVLKRTGHNHTADIWSFGCLLIEMLSGKTPWSNHNSKFSQIIGYISSGIHPPFPHHLTKQCTSFLQSCLDPVPSRRLDAQQLQKHRFLNKNQRSYEARPISKNLIESIKSKNPTIDINSHSKPLNNQQKNDLKSHNTIYEVDINQLEDIKKDDHIYYGSSGKKRNSQITKHNVNHENKKKSHTKRQSQNNIDNYQLGRKQTSNIQKQINELDKLENDMNEVSIEEDFPKDKYYIKQTLASLKKNKQTKHISKTSTAMKNTQDNLVSIESSFGDYPARSNTDMSHENQAINTMISRAQRMRYIQEQSNFLKQRESQKRKWEQQLKQGAQILKKQFSNRYIINKM